MKEIILQKSSNKDKKYDAIVEGKKVSFGATGYEHYTDGHLIKERRDNYERRHKSIGDFNDITTPSFCAYRLLWLKPTMRGAIKDIENKFNVKIKHVKG